MYLIRVLCFRSLMEQDIHWHQAESPAKLLAIITKDSAAVGGFSGSTLGTVFSILVNFVAAIVLSHIIAWKIALVCLASVPILLGCGFMQSFECRVGRAGAEPHESEFPAHYLQRIIYFAQSPGIDKECIF